ncbi:MAG: RNA polymerase sigma factor [Eubacteriales bacterium]|jgi:RNA polymerase sigma factor (sigma-70 family)
MEKESLTLDEITELYYDEIFNYCRLHVSNDHDAYDITQSVFLSLCKCFSKINLNNVRQWLYNAAHNIVVDYYRNKKKEAENRISTDIFDESLDIYLDFTDEISGIELNEYINKVISKLTPDEEELYNDIWVCNKSYKAVSRKNNISEAALRKRISRLAYKLRKLIKSIL